MEGIVDFEVGEPDCRYELQWPDFSMAEPIQIYA